MQSDYANSLSCLLFAALSLCIEANAQVQHLSARPPISDGLGALYLPTNSGVYASTDGGSTWKEDELHGVVIRIATDGRGGLFAGTNHGYYKRSKGGKGWTDITIQENNPLRNGGLVFVADTGRIVLAVRYGDLFRSIDGGNKWAVTAGLPKGHFDNLLDSPDGLHIVHDSSHVVYESTDKGERWQRSARFASLNGSVDRLVADGGTLYVLSLQTDKEENRLIYRSTDGGNRWERIALVLPRYGRWLGVFGGTLYVVDSETELFKSTDFSTWTTCSTTNDADRLDEKHSAMTLTPHGLFMTTGWNGMFRSTDGGKTWILAVNGLLPPHKRMPNDTIRLNCR